jgi:hypothetical protein
MLERLEVTSNSTCKRVTTREAADELSRFADSSMRNVTQYRDHLVVEWSKLTEGRMLVHRVGAEAYCLEFELDEYGP